MTTIRFPTPEELDQGFAEQCWQDYLRSKQPTRYPRTDAIAELEDSGFTPAQLTVPPTIPAIEPEGGPWMTPEVDVMAAPPRPPLHSPRVTVEAPAPLRAEPTEKWCNQCGRMFRYASAGMAAIQLAAHMRRAHGAPIDTRGPDPEGRKQRIGLARKRAWARSRARTTDGPGTAHVSATNEPRPEPAG